MLRKLFSTACNLIIVFLHIDRKKQPSTEKDEVVSQNWVRWKKERKLGKGTVLSVLLLFSIISHSVRCMWLDI